MIGQPCRDCGHIHTTTDARAVGRFTAAFPMFVAAHAGTAARATRAEAEADECAWRQQTRQGDGEASDTEGADPRRLQERSSSSAPVTDRRRPADQPFPAVEMETAARAKAWRDLLGQIRLSFAVWAIDDDVRAECGSVIDWIRCCRDDLSRWAA